MHIELHLHMHIYVHCVEDVYKVHSHIYTNTYAQASDLYDSFICFLSG